MRRPKSMKPLPRSKACRISRPMPNKPTKRKYEKPATYFSASLETPESRKTNTQLVEDLKSAPGVDESKLDFHVAWTIFEDGNDDPDEKLCVLGGNEVHGGRLGRDHTLEDVPSHYLRDRLMSFINESMPQDNAPEARRRVFSDLNEAEIAIYADTIRESEVRFTGEVQMWTGHEWRERCRAIEEEQSMTEEERRTKEEEKKMRDIVRIVKENPSIKNAGEAINISKQEAALEHIDVDIDMTPHLSGYRDYDLEPIQRSVVSPRAKDPLPEEEEAFTFDREMHYDCDQVRALIKRFVSGLTRWDLDDLRRACGLERPQLIGFLEKSGPQAGEQSQAYALCWEFFRRREVLGMPPFFDKERAEKVWGLPKRRGAVNAGSSQQRQQQKRKSDAGDAAHATKRTRA